MKLEQLNPEQMTFDFVIKNQYSLYYILESDSGITPFRLVSFAKEGLALPTDNYILVRLTRTSEEETEIKEELKPEPVKPATTTPNRVPRGSRNEYKFNGTNDKGTVKIYPTTAARLYGGIRISCATKDEAHEYFEYIREQFYDRDVATISIPSIFEDLGVNKERLEKDFPNASRWGYMTLDHGPCKYITTDDVTKNKNDSWFGFTLVAPIIINGLEESGWYAKKKEIYEEEK